MGNDLATRQAFPWEWQPCGGGVLGTASLSLNMKEFKESFLAQETESQG